ncbi:hypothetical protein PG999_000282 [Apiospora kogelbergensis]|uniref:Uncharacterized protein n=1 Tax=Apiospora kogelbergensis TaxID=1337665 RepID=A0AAW0RBG9_9PEZI
MRASLSTLTNAPASPSINIDEFYSTLDGDGFLPVEPQKAQWTLRNVRRLCAPEGVPPHCSWHVDLDTNDGSEVESCSLETRGPREELWGQCGPGSESAIVLSISSDQGVTDLYVVKGDFMVIASYSEELLKSGDVVPDQSLIVLDV